MNLLFRTLSLLVVFAANLLLLTVANAHPGHDHSTPSGVWPAHAESDVVPQNDFESASTAPAPATVWKLADGTTGSSSNQAINANINTVVADVNTVAFDSDYVYIRTSGIPSHSIGPFGGPNIPADQDATYRLSLNPTEAAVHEVTALSNIGVAVNGASLFNWSDATGWDPNTNQLVNFTMGQFLDWNTNAVWRRQTGLDDAGGHPAGGDSPNYHYHQSPYALVEQLDPGNSGQQHSPVIGYAFDGYPIYGPYAYANGVDDTAGFQQMTSSYQLISSRPVDGPSEIDFELGSFAEDFEYVDGSGTLNEFNMKFVNTPEYPQGTWAYFTTFDLNGSGTAIDGEVAFPFLVGPSYFGEVDQVMLGRDPQIVVPNDVTFYFNFTEPESTGDFNQDGVVDAADYTLWRSTEGSTTNLVADANGDGMVDLLDYNVWRSNYGLQPGTASSVVAIPEPSTAWLLTLSLLVILTARPEMIEA